MPEMKHGTNLPSPTRRRLAVNVLTRPTNVSSGRVSRFDLGSASCVRVSLLFTATYSFLRLDLETPGHRAGRQSRQRVSATDEAFLMIHPARGTQTGAKMAVAEVAAVRNARM